MNRNQITLAHILSADVNSFDLFNCNKPYPVAKNAQTSLRAVLSAAYTSMVTLAAVIFGLLAVIR